MTTETEKALETLKLDVERYEKFVDSMEKQDIAADKVLNGFMLMIDREYNFKPCADLWDNYQAFLKVFNSMM